MSLSSKPYDYPCIVTQHQNVGNHLKILTLEPLKGTNLNPKNVPDFVCEPGQFVMVDLPTQNFFFRRPFSILNIHPNGAFDIYYKIVGVGTSQMSELCNGDILNILGPLGKGFTPPEDPKNALLIGGGIGIAPLYLLGKQLKNLGKLTPVCIYGVRTKREIGLKDPLVDVFGKLKLMITTDDGSEGHLGNVCDLLKERTTVIQDAKEAYICGPTPMMEASVKVLKNINPNIRIEVSLEEHMPCGTGACTGCVVFRKDQILPSKTCIEGPVFNADQIFWPGELPSEEIATNGLVSSCQN